MQKKYNSFKKLKIKIIKKRKKNGGRKKKGNLHRTAKAQRRDRSL